MKLLVALFLSLLFTNIFTAKNEEIPVTIHFNFDKTIQFEKGKINIKETNQIFEITKLEDFTIPLKKGKYTIIFSSEKFGNYSVSKKISEKNNSFNLYIRENSALEIQQEITEENFEKQLENGRANFINFGFNTQNFTDFKKKYGIGNKNQGCIISGSSGESATKNNKFLAVHLDKKYGKVWREDLPFTPFGLAEN